MISCFVTGTCLASTFLTRTAQAPAFSLTSLVGNKAGSSAGLAVTPKIQADASVLPDMHGTKPKAIAVFEMDPPRCPGVGPETLTRGVLRRMTNNETVCKRSLLGSS